MMSDTIADMLTRIRNAGMVKKKVVGMHSSKIKLQISKVLLDEGYILGYSVSGTEKKPTLSIELKYFNHKHAIISIKRESLPGLRVYKKSKSIGKVLNGLGISILTTSKGVMTGKEAIRQNLGGELLCTVF